QQAYRSRRGAADRAVWPRAAPLHLVELRAPLHRMRNPSGAMLNGMADAKRVYRGVPEWSRAQAEEALASGDAWAVRDALLSISFHDPDWRYAQDTCLRYVDDPDVCQAAVI